MLPEGIRRRYPSSNPDQSCLQLMGILRLFTTEYSQVNEMKIDEAKLGVVSPFLHITSN